MSRGGRYSVMLVFAGAVCGCSPVLRQPVSSGQLASGHATLAVQNHLPEAMAIYAVSASDYTWRLGTVSALGDGLYRFPSAVLTELGDIALVARPVGPGSPLTFGRVSVVPGSKVELVLDRSLSGSGVWVR